LRRLVYKKISFDSHRFTDAAKNNRYTLAYYSQKVVRNILG